MIDTPQTPQAPTEPGAAPELDFSLGVELQAETPFLGQIVVDEFVPGRHGDQWHTAVKPLEYSIGGKTGAFHTYAKVSTVAHSVMGAQILAFRTTFGTRDPDTGAERKIGRGQLNGLVAWFVRRDIKFGKDKLTGEDMKAEGVLIPIRLPSPEESARLAAGPAPALTAEAAPPPAKAAWTPEEVAAVLALIGGKKPVEYVRAATQAPGLSAEVKNAVLNGDAVRYLTEHGLVTTAPDGTVTVLEESSLGAAA